MVAAWAKRLVLRSVSALVWTSVSLLLLDSTWPTQSE